ncbi:MAG: polymer-forming cytoskeletal protein [Acidobacteriota bacterium]|nr:polymer-forming cytoskeletal protein [Acidobacteriota bacterium]
MADKGMLSGLILEGTRFEGKLFFKNKMRIDGEFEGEIQSEDQLIVGQKAKIHAHIKVKQLTVMGRVEGSVSECDLLEIQEGGQVFGEISVKTLNIKPGAIFDGKCSMIKDHQN